MTQPINPWADSPEEIEATAKTGTGVVDIKHLSLKDGDSTVRVLGNYKFYHEHWFNKVKRTVVCPGAKECPVCSHPDKEKYLGNARALRNAGKEKEAKELFKTVFRTYDPRPAYAINVIDRADGTVKIWKFSRNIKLMIEDIAKKYGDPSQYDLIITRKGKGLETKYTVFPDRENKPLTEAEKNLKVFALGTIFKATPLDKINAYLRGEVPAKRQQPTSSDASVPADVDPSPTVAQADLGKTDFTDLTSGIADDLGIN